MMKHMIALLVPLFAVACAKTDDANDVTAPADLVQDDNAATNCPVYASRDWQAWVDAEPPLPARLHIRGQVDMPTPGYAATWRLGFADRAMPPGQHIHLNWTPPEGMAAQVITTQDIAYEGEAAYPAYRSIIVHCGDKVLAEISPIPVAQ